ncbi:MAG: HK97 family phage prohead protease [Halioglobus sp.]|nr:HK97 family phage prohead protease [Halioglobus sp.]
MTTEFTPLILEFKRAVNDAGEFSGYCSTFGGPPDLAGDIFKAGAFTEALKAHRDAGTKPALLWNHNLSEPIGAWMSFVEDSHGLLGRGKITPGVRRGDEAIALMRDGAMALSVGFTVAPGGWITEGGYRTITKVARLHEVSLVSVPCNPYAQVSKSKPATVRDFQQALRGMGFSNRESKFVTTHGFRDLLAPGERSQLDLLTEKIEQLQRIIEAKL